MYGELCMHMVSMYEYGDCVCVYCTDDECVFGFVVYMVSVCMFCVSVHVYVECVYMHVVSICV